VLQTSRPACCADMLKASKAHLTGLLLIFAVAVIWIVASFIVQSIEDRLHPFLLTFLCNLFFLIYLPISWIHDRRRCAQLTISSLWWAGLNALPCASKCCNAFDTVNDSVRPCEHGPSATRLCCKDTTQIGACSQGSGKPHEAIPVLDETPPAGHLGVATPRGLAHVGSPPAPVADIETLEIDASASQPSTAPDTLEQAAHQRAPRWTVIKAAAAVGPLWFLAQLCFNMSLHMTSVTSNTILSSPASLFTFFLSVIFIGEKFTVGKLVAVLLTIAGASRSCNIAPVEAELIARV
jgi:solute carrier family 35, member F5